MEELQPTRVLPISESRRVNAEQKNTFPGHTSQLGTGQAKLLLTRQGSTLHAVCSIRSADVICGLFTKPHALTAYRSLSHPYQLMRFEAAMATARTQARWSWRRTIVNTQHCSLLFFWPFLSPFLSKYCRPTRLLLIAFFIASSLATKWRKNNMNKSRRAPS